MGKTRKAPAETPPAKVTHPTQERTLTPEQEARAVELSAAGVPFRRIGEMMEVSHTTVWRTVKRALKDHYDERYASLRDFVARESVRLDKLDQAWLPRALRGERDAAVIVLRSQQARLRLAAAAGITAAQKHQLSVTNSGVIDQEIQELLSKLGDNDRAPTGEPQQEEPGMFPTEQETLGG